MKQTIEINVPEGYKAVWNENTNQIDLVKKQFKSTSWEEFCENHPFQNKTEYYISSSANIVADSHSTTKIRDKFDSNNLATKEDAEGILALIKLKRLHDEWIGDWKPLQTISESIFVIKYRQGDIKILLHSSMAEHNILDFPTGEMAREFLHCFENLIKEAKDFI